MDKKVMSTEKLNSLVEQAAETRKWRSSYDRLVAKLGELGTQVKITRTLESDQDVAPYRFVRNGVHEFIFPPQADIPEDNKSRIIDPTPGYDLRREEVTWKYDKSQVKGHLKVTYDDAGSVVHFSVTDLMGESELSGEVLAVIEQGDLAHSNPALQPK